ncbi:hypothetical protein LXL04_025680 [Taraxacum kok-saghyz]
MDEKRRLPSWMTAASTANKPTKTLDLDPDDIITNQEVNIVTKSTKPKAKVLIHKHKKEVSPSSDTKSLLVKCETKRKKRETVEKEAIEPHDFKQEKKKLRRVKTEVEEPHISRKKKEDNSQSSDEDDEDLTMDDLLTIAQQFVENDKRDTGQQKSSEKLLKRKNSSHSSSSVNTNSIIAPQDTKPPIQSTENTTSTDILTMTGDPAQDMLDLLLGPLLKKPIPKKEVTLYEDMIVPHEVKNHEHDPIVSNKPVDFTKKKSSLRDAVAMFLD